MTARRFAFAWWWGIAAVLAPAVVQAQGVGGIAGWAIVGKSTVAAMPAASTVNRGLWYVTDDADCDPATADDGFIVCLDIGASWLLLGPSAGGGGAATDVTCTDCVALGSETTGSYAAGDAEAGAALTGDSATAFFSAGALEDARVDGSLEADEVVLVGDVDGAANAADLDEVAVETELEAVLDLDQLQGQVTDAQIADGAVDGGTGGEIADGSVTAADLGADSVAASELDAAAVEAELEAVLDLADQQGAVTDAQVPDTITVDLATTATTATTANAGDSATAFFSAGTIEAARLPDLSGLNGAVTDAQVPDDHTVASSATVASAQCLQLASLTAASAACVCASADRLYHDTDCDGTKDAGEEFIDQAGGGGTPGGSAGQLQWNSAGAFAGVANSTVDGSGNIAMTGYLVNVAFVRVGSSSTQKIALGRGTPSAPGKTGIGLALANDHATIEASSGASSESGFDAYISRKSAGLWEFGNTWQAGDNGTRPTCDSTVRGRYWHDFGGAGVADSIAVCLKKSDDTYTWLDLEVAP